MSNETLVRLANAHAGAQMVGWDFSRLDGRLIADSPDWDFDAICAEAISEADSALDLGTGGGERLSELCCGLGSRRPTRVTATEGWQPNVPVARKALEPLGVDVVEYDAEQSPPMPFDDASFDLVMARHESYDIDEVAAEGLALEGDGEWSGDMRFSDATALVEYMGLVPWDVPGFTVEAHLGRLMELDAGRPIVVTQRRFWFAARRTE